jgi:UDP-2-acetamido-3-amino-2,3-dideoxy-glucuronate N-acetyltransferase
MSISVFVHQTAVVDAGADVGAGTKIWHFSHVASGAVIGMHCTLGQNVYVAPHVRLGDGVSVGNNVSLYDGVVLEDRVFVGPSAVFTNVEIPRANPGRRAAAAAIVVGQGATIGANATLLAGVRVGPWAFVGAGAVVTRAVPAHALVVGTPARRRGWVCECGRRLGDGLTCEPCGVRYALAGEVLDRAP